MCGLTGFVGAGGQAELRAMMGALYHRGPDDEGSHIEPEHALHLGFRRLAVIDIAGGHQPMWNEDRSICVLFNGEIYNQTELRTELLAAGHVFRSLRSDTEVLVHGYEQWGQDLPAKLNGMFAFVIWDRPRRLLFAARDRFGEKPFFYTIRPGFFAFASELSALIRHPEVDRTIDPRALQKYFAYGYIPAPNALYRGTRKLPGGCSLTLDLADFSLREHRTWRFAINADTDAPAARIPALTEELRSLLDHAVARRLVSDVPLGVFLSGGIDSSIVLALAARHRPPASLDTFTIGFNEASFNEAPYARQVAAAIGTRHHERIMDFAAACELSSDVLTRLDEPTGDASILPTSMLAAFARQRVTVALTGDGGDELFAGYDPFAALGPASRYDRLVPPPVHRLLRRLADTLPRATTNMSLDFKIRRALMGMSYTPGIRLPVWMSPLEPARMGDLFDTPLPADELYSEAIELWDNTQARNPIDRGLEFFHQSVSAGRHPGEDGPRHHAGLAGGAGSVPGQRRGGFLCPPHRMATNIAGASGSFCCVAPPRAWCRIRSCTAARKASAYRWRVGCGFYLCRRPATYRDSAHPGSPNAARLQAPARKTSGCCSGAG